MSPSKRANEPGYIGMFFSTPELVLCLCQVLDDADLLVLSQVSSRLNTHALQTFFIFHGMTLSQITSGIFSLSSLSLPAFCLAIFLSSLKVTKLSCTFDPATAQSDTQSLQRVLLRLPPIPELNIITYTEAERNISRSYWTKSLELSGTFSDLLFALDPYKNFLILADGRTNVSKHRRMVHPKLLPDFPFVIRGWWSLIASSPLICSYLLAQRLVDLSARVSSALADPRIRTLQDERIHDDVKRFCKSGGLGPGPRAMRITSPMLSNSPSLARWTLVTFDENVMTHLYISRMHFLDGEQWHSILSSLRLSRLWSLTIGCGIHISLTTLILFLDRHSTIRSLALGHYSIPYSSYPSNPHTTLSLSSNFFNNLKILHASSKFIHLLLRSIPGPLPNLCRIYIGPRLRRSKHPRYDRPDMREKVETPFDFAAWESALTTVGECTRDVEMLGMTLPGGSVASDWLASSAAAGMSKLHTEELSIATERGIPLSSSIIPLLADWIIGMFLTTVLKTIVLKPWVIVGPSERAGFEKSIREATGAGDVVVDFSAGRHGLDW
jgi:hypothetical protein